MKEKLVIEGGTPVRNKFLPYGFHHIDEKDIESVSNVLRSGWITTGPKVPEFEDKVCRFADCKYGVAVNSGGSALHVGAAALGLEHGDEVITTPYTFAATANAIIFPGAKPVFVDIEQETRNIDVSKIENSITKRTRMILPVHYSGQSCEMDELLEIAEKHDLRVFEDAAHALGAEYKGKKVGCFDAGGIFSFHPVKHATTAEGGMFVTNDEAVAERARRLRTYGISKDVKERLKGSHAYDIEEMGHNYRMSDIQAALGISQMKKLPEFIRRRQELASFYAKELADVEQIELPVVRNSRTHVWHIYTILINPEKLKATRDEIVSALKAENIGVNVHYIPLHYFRPYGASLGYKKGDFPTAEDTYERLITIPLFPAMTDQDARDVVEAIRKVMNHYAK